LNEQNFNEISKNNDFKSKNKLYESVGRGFLSRRQLSELFLPFEKSVLNSIFKSDSIKNKINVSKYENGIAVNFATCCSPIKGDDIISVMSYGRGLVVHSTMCESLSYYHKDNFYRSNWGVGSGSLNLSSRIKIIIKNEPGALFSITSVFDKHHINIENIRIAERTTKAYTFIIDIKIENSDKLKFLLSEMSTLNQVYSVVRQSLNN